MIKVRTNHNWLEIAIKQKRKFIFKTKVKGQQHFQQNQSKKALVFTETIK